MTARSQVVVFNKVDNVATALVPLKVGAEIFGRRAITVLEEIAFGHKVAIANISRGQSVVKYGQEIGLATSPIKTGQHVHLHNVRSRRSQKG